LPNLHKLSVPLKLHWVW